MPATVELSMHMETKYPKTHIAQLLDVHAVGQIFKAAPSTIWQWAKDGVIPKPIKIAPKTTRWRADEIKEFIDRL
jgi:predicted DNA-binding transcriptional regulator AlpA